MAALVLSGVVTRTLAVPAVPAGVVAVMLVALTTLTLVAATPPMVTPVAPVKLVPVMVTLVPPAVEPAFGEMPVSLVDVLVGDFVVVEGEDLGGQTVASRVTIVETRRKP